MYEGFGLRFGLRGLNYLSAFFAEAFLVPQGISALAIRK